MNQARPDDSSATSDSRSAPGDRRATPGLWIAAAGLIALAAGLRVAAGFTDFWMDEVWTLFYAQLIESVGDVFTEIHSGNNHYLMTVYIHLVAERVEPTTHWIVYRIPALAMGLATVVLAAHLARRRGRMESLVTLVVLGFSYLMVHYSSEARGYAPVVFVSFLSLWMARAYVERPRVALALGFWAVGSLGFLCHLMYLNTLLALGVWFLVELFRGRSELARTFRQLAMFLLGPGVFLGWFYWFEVRHLHTGIGPERKFLGVIVETLSFTGGGPPSGTLATAAAVLVAACLVASLAWLGKQRDREWVFLGMMSIGSPLTLILVMQPDYLFPRYFLLSVAFGSYACASFLASWMQRESAVRWAAMLLLAGYLLGNGLRLSLLLEEGRGSYREAVAYMAKETPGKITAVSSMDEFADRFLVEYYGRFLPDGEQIVMAPRKELPPRGSDWFIRPKIGEPVKLAPEVTDRYRNVYVLRKTYPYAGLSGSRWALYQNRDR